MASRGQTVPYFCTTHGQHLFRFARNHWRDHLKVDLEREVAVLEADYDGTPLDENGKRLNGSTGDAALFIEVTFTDGPEDLIGRSKRYPLRHHPSPEKSDGEFILEGLGEDDLLDAEAGVVLYGINEAPDDRCTGEDDTTVSVNGENVEAKVRFRTIAVLDEGQTLEFTEDGIVPASDEPVNLIAFPRS